MTDAVKNQVKPKSIWHKVIVCLLAAMLLLSFAACGNETVSEGQPEEDLRQQLKNEDVTEIVIQGTLYLNEPAEVVGSKTITGDGKIKAEGSWAGEDAYLLSIASGTDVTLAGSVTIDADGTCGGVYVSEGATLAVTEEATVRGAAKDNANVMAAGEVQISGGFLSGAEGNNVYVTGTLQQDGGEISGGYNNVYVAEGASFVWNAGSNLDAKNDGVLVANGADLKVTAATAILKNAGAQGVHMEGKATIDGILITGCQENQIKIEETAELVVNECTLSGSKGHGVTNRGKMTMNSGDITGAASCGIVNTGVLEVNGGGIRTNGNKGILVKNGGSLVIANENVAISGNVVGIAIEENATADISKAKINSNTLNNISCFGELYIHDIMMGGSGSNCIATNYGGHVVAKNMEIISTNGNNGIYNINGSLVELTDCIISGTKTNAIRNLDADLVGTNVTISNCSGGISTGDYIFGEAGSVKITNLTMSGVSGSSVSTEAYCGGTIELTNAKLGPTGSNNLSIKGGHLILTNATVEGNSENSQGTTHGILMDEGGKITATDVTIQDTKYSAIRNRGGYFEGTNVTLTHIGQHGISNASHGTTKAPGVVVIKNLKTSFIGSKNIDNNSKGGAVEIYDGYLCQTTDNSVSNYNGTTVLHGVQIQGTVEKWSDYLYGVMITGGEVKMKDVTIGATYAGAIRSKGGSIEGTNITGSGGISFIRCSDGGNVTIDGMTAENYSDSNILTEGQAGTVSIKNAQLGITPGNNVACKGGVIELFDSNILGTTGSGAHGIYVTTGKVLGDNVTIENSNSALRVNGSKAVAEVKNSTFMKVRDDGVNLTGGNVILNNVTIDTPKDCGIYVSAGTVTGTDVTMEGITTYGFNVAKGAGDITVTGLKVNAPDASSVQSAQANTNVQVANGYAGTVTLSGTAESDAVLGKTNTNGIRTYTGTLILNHVDIMGTVKDHAICSTASGVVKAEDLEIYGAKAAALRFKDTASFTGKDVAVANCDVGVYLHGSGTHTITGLNVTGSSGSNILLESSFKGTLTVAGTAEKAAYLGASASHNIRLYGGTVNLTNVEIAGTTVDAIHGILSDKAVINAENLVIHNTLGSGLRLRDKTVFTGTNVSMYAIAGDGVSLAAGTADITGLQIASAGGYGVDNYDTVILRGSNNSISGCGDLAVHNTANKTVTVEGGKVTGNVGNEGIMTMNAAVAGTVTNSGELNLNGNVDGAVSNTGRLAISAVHISGGVYSENTINYVASTSAHTAGDPLLLTVPQESIKGGTVLVSFADNATASALANTFAVPKEYEQIVGTSAYHDGILEVYENTIRIYRDTNVYVAIVNGTMKYKTLDDAITYAASVSDAQTAATIQLLDDIYLGSTVTIPAGSNIIITDNGSAKMIKRDSAGSWAPTARGVMIDVMANASLTLTGAVTLDGNKASLTPTNANWVLIDNFGNVNIGAGVVLQNNKSTRHGAAIRVEAGANLNVTGGKFLNNESIGQAGGAIYVNNGAEDVSVQNAHFEGNACGTHGGAISAIDGNVYDRLFVKNSTFTNNLSGKDSKANAYGGAINTYGAATIEYCTFTNNHGTHGGAVSCGNGSNVTISGCQFIGNTSSQTGGATNGAANATIRISNSSFTGNIATGNGGAVSMAKGSITGCTFTGNNANQGGAINSTASIAANLVVTNSSITGNTAKNGGGINAATGFNITLDGCTVTGNDGTNSDPQGDNIRMAGNPGTSKIVVMGSSQVTVLDLHLQHASYVTVSGSLKEGSQIILNWPVYSASDNRVPVNNTAVKFDSAEIAKENMAYFALSNALTQSYHLALDGDKIIVKDGGAVAKVNGVVYGTLEEAINAAADASTATKAATVVLLSDVSVSKTITIPANANIIITDDGNVRTISRTANFDTARGVMFDLINGNSSLGFASTSNSNGDCRLIIDGNNKASHSGNWAIVVVRGGSILTVNSGVKFTNNYSTGAGAVIRVENYTGAKLIVNGGVFENNTSDGNSGGAINLLCTSAESVIRNAVFTGNHAPYGGAVIVQEKVTGLIENCIFTGNTATADGGAIYTYGTVTVNNCTFTGNTSPDSGAIHVQAKGTANVNGGSFTQNKATNGYGGAISAWGGTLNATGATFTGNSATAAGGAVLGYKGGAAIVNLTNCVFTDNTATKEGGALAAWESSNTVTNCTFTNNTGTYGGAIHMNNQTTSKLVVSGGTFTGNKATKGEGGAIYASVKSPKVEISGAAFNQNNSAVAGGAVFAGTTYGMPISDCTFTGNTAPKGGAITVPTGSYLVLHNVTCSGNSAKSEGNDVRLGGNTSKVSVSGKIVAAIHNQNSSTVYVTGTLSVDSSLACDWQVGMGRIPAVAVQFDSEEAAAANMPYISVGDLCTGGGYGLKQSGTTAVLYQPAASANVENAEGENAPAVSEAE